jgi:hypothetical protein
MGYLTEIWQSPPIDMDMAMLLVAEAALPVAVAVLPMAMVEVPIFIFTILGIFSRSKHGGITRKEEMERADLGMPLIYIKPIFISREGSKEKVT